MELKFRVSKIANHFFFVSTLGDWNNSLYREKTRKEWKAMLGVLNTNEKKAIKKLEKILFKYQKSKDKWLHNIFYAYDSEQKIWEWIKNNYTKEEFNDLKEVFGVTQGKFDELWRKIDVKKVENFCEGLKNDYNQGMFSDIPKFIGFKNSDKLIINIAVCPIVLGMGVAGHAWGNKDAIINIEFSIADIKENNILEIALLLSHEIFHAVFNRAKCFQIFKEEITKNGIDKIMPSSSVLADFYDRPFVLVEEAIVATFSDMFYQLIKYSRADWLLRRMAKLFDEQGGWVIKKQIIKGKRIERDDALIYLGYKVFPVVLDYIYKNKPIDRDLIRLFALNVKELISWEKRYKTK